MDRRGLGVHGGRGRRVEVSATRPPPVGVGGGMIHAQLRPETGPRPVGGGAHPHGVPWHIT